MVSGIGESKGERADRKGGIGRESQTGRQRSSGRPEPKLREGGGADSHHPLHVSLN